MGGERAFKVNTKKARAAAAKAECFVELSAFFACMMANKYDADGACVTARKALDRCVSTAASRTRTRTTINYHLQRLSRALRR